MTRTDGNTQARPQAQVTPDSASAALSGSNVIAELSGLHVSLNRDRQTIDVLRGVDLQVRSGEIVGLVGESGSGKSILGLTLLGLLPEESAPEIQGSVNVDGVDMIDPDREALRELRRRHMGAVFQDPLTSLDPTMRIGTQIVEVAGSSGAAIELLRSVGVPDPVRRLKAYPHELSGGLRQRVTIAMAVAGEPRIIVADEPTTALDVTVQAQILELLSRLRAELGCSVLFITHDLAVASQIADRIVVLYAGRVAELAPSEALLRDPHHPYTAALLRSRLDIDMERGRPLPTLEGDPPDPRNLPAGCPFAPRCTFSMPACEQSLPALEGDIDRQDACIRRDELDLKPKTVVLEPWAAPVIQHDATPVLLASGLLVEAHPRGLRRRRGVQILRGVDLRVAAGEAVALVGESGSGKTTFLRAAAGLSAFQGGQFQLADQAPQMVFQDAGATLTPWLTIGEMIEDRLRSTKLTRAQRRERAAEALERVGLSAQALTVRPAQLSGGQRQRVALARAIIVPPSLLLCDEPTSALDVSVAASVLNLIGRLRRDLGMAVLLVTHDLAVARLVADRIAVMYLGQIVEYGDADSVIAQPAHPYTKALVASLPGPDATSIKLAGEPPSLFAPPSGCSFHPRCPQAREVCSAREPHFVEICHAPKRVVDCVLAEPH